MHPADINSTPTQIRTTQNTCFFTTKNDVCCYFVTYGLYYVEVDYFMHTFWRVIINWCWILSKAFSASIKMIIWFLFFNSLLWYITLIDLYILKNPWIPGINSTWSWYDPFNGVFGFCLLVFCWGFLHLCSLVILVFHFKELKALPLRP